MKIIKIWCLGLSLWCATAFAATPLEGVYFQDNFDSYATGTFPTGWLLNTNGAGSTQQYIDTTHFASSPKSLHLMGSSCWAAGAKYPVSMPLSANLILTVRIFSNQIVGGGCSSIRTAVALGNQSVRYGSVDFNGDGFIYAERKFLDRNLDVKLMEYLPQRWYTVQTRYNLTERKFDVYVDGFLKFSATS